MSVFPRNNMRFHFAVAFVAGITYAKTGFPNSHSSPANVLPKANSCGVAPRITEEREINHAACGSAQLQIALEVGNWMPNLPWTWCIKEQASGLTRPTAFSARLFPLS